MGLNKGRLDRPVTIESLTSSNDDGYPVETWTTLSDRVWMERRDMSGAERFRAGQLSAASITIWTMPYWAQMDPERVDVPKTRRISYEGRTYDIVSAMPIGRKDAIELTTIAKVVNS